MNLSENNCREGLIYMGKKHWVMFLDYDLNPFKLDGTICDF